jgi:hypothetical protein
MTRRTAISAWILLGLIALVFITVLVAPAVQKGPPFSSYSAASDGTRLAHDLIGRLGWKPERREVAFSDSLRDVAPIQVLVDVGISDAEAARLLSFVRAGGGLIVAGGRGPIQDSLGVVAQSIANYVEEDNAPNCAPRGTWQAELVQTSMTSGIDWSRPAPPDTIGYGNVTVRDRGAPPRQARPAVGMPLGAGRIVVIADEGFLSNDVIRRCELGTDVAFVRMIEYLSRGNRGIRVAFDEFHHGYGVRGGSFAAIRMYLGDTSSGRMLAQIGIAGLLLLFAAAPRPLAPRDPTHVARRSPLEHADALAHAYASVNATRTATTRLLAGVRRRSRGRSRAKDADAAFLASAAVMSPKASKAADIISNALERPVPQRQLPEVAAALETLEQELSRPPSSPR